jgi:hypothetical protein
MPNDLGPKKIKTNSGDVHVRTRIDVTARLWQYKRDIYILTNIHSTPAGGNFCNSGGKAIKPEIVTDYSHHMGYVDKGDRMANSYSICHRTLKWTKKPFFHLFKLAIFE